MKTFEERLEMLKEELANTTPEELYNELQSYEAKGPIAYGECEGMAEVGCSEEKQKIQNFLNCCIMETQGNDLTHNDLAKLLEFYFNDEMYCEGLSCYREEK